MSTRGCIARPLGDIGWEGKYQHSDSYPTWLGKNLWHDYHGRFKGDLDAMLQFTLLDHPAGWSIYPERCYCHWKGREDSHDNWVRFIAGDEANDGDPLFMEWVYILTPMGMDIQTGRRVSDDQMLIGETTDGPLYCEGTYVHQPVAFAPWDGPEPDWEALEKARYPEEVLI